MQIKSFGTFPATSYNKLLRGFANYMTLRAFRIGVSDENLFGGVAFVIPLNYLLKGKKISDSEMELYYLKKIESNYHFIKFIAKGSENLINFKIDG